MANRVSVAAMQGIYTLYQWGAMGSWTDEQLVAQFVAGHDAKEAAFRVLIHRHGPMVLGVCRRVLGDEHSAEDAFQATFLVLVKKARSLQDCKLLTNWLYGVALRVANKERVKGARRRFVETQAAGRMTRPDGDADEAELRSVIDEEIHRLPERYRVPLVLCHVQGLRHDEVARQLGCPVGTVESRLSRARAQLRDRLARRGLAPAPSALGALFRPQVLSEALPPLIEATLQAARDHSASRAFSGTKMLSGSRWLKSTFGFIPTIHAATVASTLVIAAGFAVASLAAHRTNQAPAARNPAAAPPKSTPPAHERPGGPALAALSSQPEKPIASSIKPATARTPERDKAIRQSRFPSAIATPLTGITIDGRLDDWPQNAKRYPIANQLRNHPGYNSKMTNASSDQDAYFMAGYDPKAQQIYLAVAVHDNDVVVHSTDVLKTDAVEIYIDGTLAKKIAPELPSGDWRETLDAATMPVLQYVGVPGPTSAYGDRWDANPSLVYARTKHTTTRMKYLHKGDFTTYEWSVTPFDRFPDRPARLYPGKRVGLDVAVVDKDSDPTTGSQPPTFLTWAAAPEIFKGVDPNSLGELILVAAPPP
jgi:RNA polymerase sigma factor (sigma-70 family)